MKATTKRKPALPARPVGMKPDQFRALRKRLGLTQAQIAERLDVRVLAVIKWEGGRARITPLRASDIRRRLLGAV